MKSIEIDRSKRLKDEPNKGHNRWHTDIPAILEVDPDDFRVCTVEEQEQQSGMGGNQPSASGELSAKIIRKTETSPE